MIAYLDSGKDIVITNIRLAVAFTSGFFPRVGAPLTEEIPVFPTRLVDVNKTPR